MIGLGLGLSLIGSGGGGGAPAFNPATLFGGGEQGVIYDLTNTATMFQERTGASATTPSGANGPIGTLKDLSPNNNWNVAPSDAARPLSRQGVGAPNVYGEFDGIDDALSVVFVGISLPWTRVSSVLVVSDANNPRIFESFSATEFGTFYCQIGTTDQYSVYNGNPIAVFTNPPGTNFVTSEKHTSAVSAGAALNNGAYTMGLAGAGVPDGLRIASEPSGTIFAAMRLYRVVQINRLLTDPEIALCRTWCGQAAGLSL